MLARLIVGLIAGLGAGVVTAFALAIGLAVLDLYLTGHGHPALSRPWIENNDWSIHLSRADVILLTGSTLAAVAAGILTAVSWKR